MSWLGTLLLRGARALVVAITMLPVLLVVILSAPAWVVWPWLGENRRESIHRMVDQLRQWTGDVLYQTDLEAAIKRADRHAQNIVKVVVRMRISRKLAACRGGVVDELCRL